MKIVLYLPNRPNQESYMNKRGLKNLKVGEVPFIIQECGNHWRKIFSIFAKICFDLNPVTDTWQEYRDNILLTNKCISSVSFSKKNIQKSDSIVLLSGKDSWPLAGDSILRIFRLPYFDYRQFPNIEITKLLSKLKKIDA